MEEIKRQLYNDLKSHLQKKEISLLIGPRQVGKTTLMKRLEKELQSQKERTLFLNLDLESDAQYVVSQTALIRKMDLELGGSGYVFIDEIQRKENTGLFLKGIYDMDLPYKFIVSGSGSLELKEKIHESLAGRKRIFEVSPVSFLEFLDYKTGYKYSEKWHDYFSIESQRVLEFLEEYLNFGGYPMVILAENRQEKLRILDEIIKSYLVKDIAYLLHVEKPAAFLLLLKILASQVGQLVKYSELAKQVGISEATVKNYLYYAENTFSIRQITPFFQNKQKEIIKSPQIYFYDLGLRNSLIGHVGTLNTPPQMGFLFQNLIHSMLIEKFRYELPLLHFWRTTDMAEVDFVIAHTSSPIPVEVKYQHLKKPEISRSFRSFLEKYEPKEAWIVNLSLKVEVMIGKTNVKFMPFYELFLESKSSAL